MSNEMIDNCFSDWKDREATAEAMIPLIGRLYRQNNVVTSIYGRAVINQSVIGILKSHRFVRQVENKELSVKQASKELSVTLAVSPRQAYEILLNARDAKV